MKAYP